MSNTLTIDEIENEITPDAVAVRCTEYEWNGKKIHPFTKTRQTAAATMEAKIFLGVGERNENGAYPEMFLDAQKIVWLCTVDGGMVRKAIVNPVAAIGHMIEWWEKEGGNLGSKKHVELLEIFASIITDITSVSAEVDQTGAKGGSENLGE